MGPGFCGPLPADGSGVPAVPGINMQIYRSRKAMRIKLEDSAAERVAFTRATSSIELRIRVIESRSSNDVAIAVITDANKVDLNTHTSYVCKSVGITLETLEIFIKNPQILKSTEV